MAGVRGTSPKSYKNKVIIHYYIFSYVLFVRFIRIFPLLFPCISKLYDAFLVV